MEKTVAGWVGKDGRKRGDADDAPGETPDAEEQTSVDLLPDSKYRVVREIAQGEISRILEIEHIELRRVCAAKVLRRPFATDGRLADALVEEGRILAAVRHHNVVEVIDVGRHASDGAFLVLELLQGRTLDAELVARGHLPVDEALQVIDGLLAGLSALHDASVVHRSLDPSHVFLARDGQGRLTVKLLGLGMARRLRSPESQVTDIGQIEGGQAFGAPELRDPEIGLIDRRSDLFSVGSLLYLMISGSAPPPVTSSEAAPPLTSPTDLVPPWVASMVARATSYNRAARFSRAEEMRAELRGTPDEPRHEFEETTTLERAPDAISAKIRLERGESRVAMAATMIGPAPGVIMPPSPTPAPAGASESTPLPAAIPAPLPTLGLPAVVAPAEPPGRGRLIVGLLGGLALVALGLGFYLHGRRPSAAPPLPSPQAATPVAGTPEKTAPEPEPQEPTTAEPEPPVAPKSGNKPVAAVAKPGPKALGAAKPVAAAPRPVVRRPIVRRKPVAKPIPKKAVAKKPAATPALPPPPPRTGIRGNDF